MHLFIQYFVRAVPAISSFFTCSADMHILSAALLPSPEKLLMFHAHFNKCLNKQKQTVREKVAWINSGWTPPPRSLPSGRLMGFAPRCSSLINSEHFTSDREDILKKPATSPPYVWDDRFCSALLPSCNHTLQWNTINGESEMRNCKKWPKQSWIQTLRLAYYLFYRRGRLKRDQQTPGKNLLHNLPNLQDHSLL